MFKVCGCFEIYASLVRYDVQKSDVKCSRSTNVQIQESEVQGLNIKVMKTFQNLFFEKL